MKFTILVFLLSCLNYKKNTNNNEENVIEKQINFKNAESIEYFCDIKDYKIPIYNSIKNV